MTTATNETGGRDGHVNEVRLVGRLSADPAELTLPSGDTLLDVPPGGGPAAPGTRGADSSSTRSTAPCGAGASKRSVADLVGRRRGRGVRGDPRAGSSAAGAATVSRYQVEVGRRAGSSVAQRPDEHARGWAWAGTTSPSRAAAGRRRRSRSTRSTSGAGISTATPPACRSWARASSTEWWWWIRAGPAAAAPGSRRRAAPRPRPGPRGTSSFERRPAPCRRWPPACAGRAPRRRTPGRPASYPTPAISAAAARSSRLTPVSTRWIGPRNSGVSSWSTSIARPRSNAAAGLARLHAEVGRIPVVAVGDQRLAVGQGRRRARSSTSGSRIAQIRCRWSLRSTKSSVRLGGSDR